MTRACPKTMGCRYRASPVARADTQADHRGQVTAANTIRIVLDVELVDESPSGYAATADGTRRKFAGWLGLLSALEALLPSSGPADDPTGGRDGEQRL